MSASPSVGVGGIATTTRLSPISPGRQTCSKRRRITSPFPAVDSSAAVVAWASGSKSCEWCGPVPGCARGSAQRNVRGPQSRRYKSRSSRSPFIRLGKRSPARPNVVVTEFGRGWPKTRRPERPQPQQGRPASALETARLRRVALTPFWRTPAATGQCCSRGAYYGRTSWKMRRRPGTPNEMRSDEPSHVTSVRTTTNATRATVRSRGTGRETYSSAARPAGSEPFGTSPLGRRVSAHVPPASPELAEVGETSETGTR
jgi:hypothetical protein